ncbi:unnamed protein product (macronuclear) [Paramecium tetraurelia]|uniref:PX domain-containing protein n=1 Tax=Paramecium tetraurelia TaxID=5888 RepID=A0E5F9_PARTE|nr:uncharacterized protein GSPATT00003387001 [Paramecium tetraurelia]CAK90526.1 unnamed protein product [Paramecium tetraurelia]|eukprot:XP_001457923.1 hypothetical protein (macronuclear) [Paramecium tetraurelia strain d4-2]
MAKVFDNIWENIVVIGLGILPLLQNLASLMWKKQNKGYNAARQQFKEKRKLFILNLCSIYTKVAILSMFTLLSILQIIINVQFHSDYVLITIIEFCQIINYLLAGLQIFEDANKYGQTTFATQLNLILQFFCFCGFAIVLFAWQINNKDKFVIRHEDISCWLMFILRGIALLLLSVFVFFIPQDKKLLQTVVSEYQYKLQMLGNEEEVQIRQQLIANESNFTFCQSGDQLQQQHITDVEVNSYQDNKDMSTQRKYIIYEITFKYQGKHKIVFRSFSDFLTFHRDFTLTYPQLDLPVFPKMTKYLTQQDIDNRRIQLDSFLKGLVNSFGNNELLLDFLNATGKTLQYKAKIPLPQQQQQKPKKIAAQQQFSKAKSIQSLIPETIWEGQDDEDEESIEVDTRKTKKASTYVKIQFGEDRQYQRFNSSSNLDEDRRNIDFDKPSDDQIGYDQSGNDSPFGDEEEKHSSQL